MELLNLFTYFGFYTKVYDTKNKHKYEDNELTYLLTDLSYTINDILPLSVLNKMYHHVNMKKSSNMVHYNQTMKCLNKLNNRHIDYIIYIDNWGAFRRIMINVNHKIIHCKNMYF